MFFRFGHPCVSKPLHSCFRRVVNSSGLPFNKSWRVISRALRGVLLSLSVTCEVLDMSIFRKDVDAALGRVLPNSSNICIRCSSPVQSLTVLTADIDQAFEACNADLVCSAWSLFASLYEKKHSKLFGSWSKGTQICSNDWTAGFGRLILLFKFRHVAAGMISLHNRHSGVFW